ncbi:Putative aminopeptidase FrvX [Paenibacillus sp. UNCCL117]|uniref:M42 family metallopeptidase n=1 Tax=unclassified Paenibacillus TaxID=185978 RepID=UPI00088D2E76|nr:MULTISPECIES: M42 family metallopeptidase [unclassified Paenibacillus]SDC49104.1 Putative aminopeptidase FrvX [Paenibacillus sp. cl123]SFW11817.1 Putative aminopeptidase FrvX [Paenibacillus sp. UNCCL117]
MGISIDENYIAALLGKLLETPSPTGYCRTIMNVLRDEAQRLGLAMQLTPKGNGIITVDGMSEGPAIGLSAHVDTLGAMVRAVRPGGTLRFTLIGGYMLGSVENEYCIVHTRDGRTYTGTIMTNKPSVHVYADARELKREEAVMEVRLDERVKSADDVRALGIDPGDFISFDPRVRMLPNGYIKSRHLDDKAGVAAVFGLLEWLKRERVTPARPLSILLSTYEEVGHGAAWLPGDISELIAVDMGAMGDDLSCTELDVSICAKDSSGPYDYAMTSKLIELAKREGLSYAVDVYPQYGSDASAALRGGSNIRAALIGPGVHASHAMERTHRQAIVNTAALLAAYVQEPAASYE